MSLNEEQLRAEIVRLDDVAASSLPREAHAGRGAPGEQRGEHLNGTTCMTGTTDQHGQAKSP
jgi:hypothetical protein